MERLGHSDNLVAIDVQSGPQLHSLIMAHAGPGTERNAGKTAFR